MALTFHPVAEIFPLLQGEEFDALVESVRAKGLLNPIWLHPDGSIVDGRNRYRACLEAGVEPRFQTWDGKGSLADFVVAQNIDRRHLNGTQRALLAKKLKPLYDAEAKVRQLATLKKGKQRAPVTQKVGERKKHEGEAAAHAAKAAGTNRQYVADLEKIEREAPEVYAKIEAGKIELPKAKRLLAKVEAEKKLLAARAIVRPAHLDRDFQCCTMQDFLGKARDLDAVITDPPYPEEFLPLYGELARLSAKALKPGGVLAVMCGQSYLPQIMADMTKHMPYRWIIAYMTPGGQSVQLWDRKVNTFWKPVLVFGGHGDTWLGDVVRSDVNDNDKRFHEWQQSESGFDRLIERLTEPDALVCDPFLGAGTTAASCVRLHRRIVGCDIDAAAVETARARVALAQRVQ